VFDEHLFALGDGEGVSVWDVATGERLLHDAGFHPLRYHPGTRQFLTTNPDGELFVLSRLVGDGQTAARISPVDDESFRPGGGRP
jgi:hypothetical protein